uniref:RNA polymerase subunit H/Rpb5 C-terminal domain-containing protein n=1 Tax=viral metagenome TaxID=1070528 RepID=A0A6C0KDH0_9ZZZZ
MEKQAIKVLSEIVTDRDYRIEYISCPDQDQGPDVPPYCIKARNIQNDIILCFLSDEDKLNIQGIKDRISIMNKEGSTRCIVVYRSSVTSSAKKSLETLEYEFELFGIHELQLNITKHRLVPRHSKVSQTEKDELDKHYKGKLPFLLQSDAVCRYYTFKKGEYVRITRKDGTIVYRVVK